MKVFFIILFSLVISIGNFSALELSLNTADTSPYSTADNTGFYDILLKEVFENIGIDIKINHLLSKRSIQNADNGIDDGEYARTEGRDIEFKNLLLVPEALVEFYFVAYAKDPGIIISGWESLTDYNVAYINGWVYLKNNVPDSTEVTLVSNEDSLFKMLLNDRVDLILYSKLRGLSKIEKDELPGIILVDPPLASRGMYLYLHKKHDEIDFLVASFNRTYKKVREEIYEREEHEKNLINTVKEKNILISEVHHRVKNNLQIILSLLNLQKNESDSVEDALNSTITRIRAMSEVHEQLYNSENLLKISMYEYLTSLIGNMSELTVDIKIMMIPGDKDITVCLDTTIPLGLIVNELFQNYC